MRKTTEMRKYMLTILVGLLMAFVVQQEAAAGSHFSDGHTLALWHLDGDGNDASAYGKDLTVESVSWVAGKWDLAMQADGMTSHAYATVPYPGTGDFTIECEVRLDNEGSGWLIRQYSVGLAGHDPWRLDTEQGDFTFDIQDSSSTQESIGIPIPGEAYSQFVHVAGVYWYESAMGILVDADNDGTWDNWAIKPTSLVIESRSDDTWVGTAWNWQPLDCTIDEVRISDSARYVPEPATVSLVALGGLALLSRRRK